MIEFIANSLYICRSFLTAKKKDPPQKNFAFYTKYPDIHCTFSNPCSLPFAFRLGSWSGPNPRFPTPSQL